MKNSILLGFHRFMLRIPQSIWQQEIARGEVAAKESISFMTDDHHRVRDFVVREMPRISKPISPEEIGQNIALELDIIVSSLDDLENKLTFLYRNALGAVTWAYPVTVEKTPHQVSFSSGETIYAA